MFLLVVLLSLLQVADAVTTYKILNNGGKELNPVMDKLFKRFGMLNVLSIKVVLVAVAGIVIYSIYPLALIPLCLLYVAVVTWNTYQLYKK